MGKAFPENWAVRITPENRNTLKYWVTSQKDFDDVYSSFKLGFFVVSNRHDNSYQIWSKSLQRHPRYTEITFKDFCENILNFSTDRLIGYKLYKRQYLEVVKQLVSHIRNYGSDDVLLLNEDYLIIEYLKSLEILETWFAPVYEKELIKIGDFVLLDNNSLGKVIKIFSKDEKSLQYQISPIILRHEGVIWESSRCKKMSLEKMKEYVLLEAIVFK